MFLFVLDSSFTSSSLILTPFMLANLSAIAVSRPSFEINIVRSESRVSLSKVVNRLSVLEKVKIHATQHFVRLSSLTQCLFGKAEIKTGSTVIVPDSCSALLLAATLAPGRFRYSGEKIKMI